MKRALQKILKSLGSIALMSSLITPSTATEINDVKSYDQERADCIVKALGDTRKTHITKGNGFEAIGEINGAKIQASTVNFEGNRDDFGVNFESITDDDSRDYVSIFLSKSRGASQSPKMAPYTLEVTASNDSLSDTPEFGVTMKRNTMSSFQPNEIKTVFKQETWNIVRANISDEVIGAYDNYTRCMFKM